MRFGQTLVRCAVGLTVAACTGSRATPPAAPQQTGDSLVIDDLLFEGTTRVWGARGDSIAVAIRLTNRRDTTLHLEYGACVLDPRLYAAAHGGRPAYAWRARPDSSLWRRPDGSVGVVFHGCPAYLAVSQLIPGGTVAPREFQWRVGLDSVRADSLRGEFRVVARLELLDRVFDVPAGQIQLP